MNHLPLYDVHHSRHLQVKGDGIKLFRNTSTMKTVKLSLKFKTVAFIFGLFALVSCATISNFDQQAYIYTTSVKVDALNVMDLATSDYSAHSKEVKELQTQLQKIYEYEKNRPKNEITLKQWDILLDSEGHLLGGFIKRWETQKTLSKTFVAETKKLVAKAFDQIAGLESKKIKASDI
jgi:hypothetical protein